MKVPVLLLVLIPTLSSVGCKSGTSSHAEHETTGEDGCEVDPRRKRGGGSFQGTSLFTYERLKTSADEAGTRILVRVPYDNAIELFTGIGTAIELNKNPNQHRRKHMQKGSIYAIDTFWDPTATSTASPFIRVSLVQGCTETKLFLLETTWYRGSYDSTEDALLMGVARTNAVGTPAKWTVTTEARGRKIQLKLKTNKKTNK